MLDLTISQKVDFLSKLRDARALVLKDAEAFHKAVGILEFMGQTLDNVK